MKIIAAAACLLLLLSCSREADIGNDDALLDRNNAAHPLSPGTTPIRIGEGGASFAACGTIGQVVNISPAGEAYLSVRAAPFNEAKEVGQLANDARMFVCTRSIDQGWLGVVVPPADATETDCGVSSPVASPRAYKGSCASGWVSSAFVRLIAG